MSELPDSDFSLLQTLRFMARDWKAKQNKSAYECGDMLLRELYLWEAKTQASDLGTGIAGEDRLARLTCAVRDYLAASMHEAAIPYDDPRCVARRKLVELVAGSGTET